MNLDDIEELQRIADTSEAETKRIRLALRRSLFVQQRAAVEDPSPRKAMICGRRAGKTQGEIRDLLLSCIEVPRSVSVYFATTMASARKLVWDTSDGIPELIHELGIESLLASEPNETDHRVDFKNGSVLWISGAESKADAKRWRGLRYRKAKVDEAQEFPDELLRYLLNEVLSPALMPMKGQQRGELTISGTPEASCAGVFYDITEHKIPGWSVHHWTCFENPHVSNPQAYIDEEIKQRALSIDDPIVQREYFGRWVHDSSERLFQYDPERNDFETLPDDPNWNTVIGVDFGFRDLTTFVVLSWSSTQQCAYFREAIGEAGKGAYISRVAEILRGLVKKYPMALIVADMGALGLPLASELQHRPDYAFNIVAAQKTEKPAFIRLMNDALRLGLIKVHPVLCAPLIAQWNKLQRDDATLIEKKSQPADFADGGLYAWRYSYAYLHEAKKPPKTAAEVLQDLERQAWERTERQFSPMEEREARLVEEEMAFEPWANPEV